jgi:hypothetical protein
MSWLYDRVISIVRDASLDPIDGKVGGLKPYGGRTVDGAKDEVLFSGVLAGIQPRGRQRGGGADIPGEASKAQWAVLVAPGAAIPSEADVYRGLVVKDDIARSFLIFAAEPSPMGWRLLCDQLEV